MSLAQAWIGAPLRNERHDDVVDLGVGAGACRPDS
ncbi:Uncharacterised protein [Mycobacterium tuberculosis]|uniref:Uncharacterized protein n=1 Tax=Mycobacterium tuberculosis TaxID=1773 RepID=A0A916PGA3_MYCTX|nr:Uncharacterised protein [Mycobacterium tuberculosis]COZ25732.1 Uncharacterised protein [Mycobacterium tuberculosis]